MKNILLFYLYIIACTNIKIKDDIDICIQYSQRVKYDLKNGVYTVYYLSKPPSTINFRLTEEEKNMIKNQYYSLKLNTLPTTLDINDKCHIMPKLYTQISIKSKTKYQQIKIDKECDNFYLFNSGKAKRIKKFLLFINDIINSKPEIRNAPKSDKVYI